jgi:sucrose-6-phosphate hydrolase SacC (GH32 family)
MSHQPRRAKDWTSYFTGHQGCHWEMFTIPRELTNRLKAVTQQPFKNMRGLFANTLKI